MDAGPKAGRCRFNGFVSMTKFYEKMILYSMKVKKTPFLGLILTEDTGKVAFSTEKFVVQKL